MWRSFISGSRASACWRNLDTGAVFDEPGVIVIQQNGGRKNVLAAGAAAADMNLPEGAQRMTPFYSHPRVILGDFEAGDALVKHAVRSVAARTIFAPDMVIHAADALPGGLAAIELRALAELGQSAGARRVHVLTAEAAHESGLGQAELEQSLKKFF